MGGGLSGQEGEAVVLISVSALSCSRAAAPHSIKDASGKRPGDADYNPRTLYVPPGWFKEAKVCVGWGGARVG
jgi:hypothetical protein